MSFCEKLHPSERGLEMLGKYLTWTFMPTAFFLWELLFFSTQEVSGSFSKALFTSAQKDFMYFLSTAGLRCFMYWFVSGTEGSVRIPTHLLSFVILQPRRKRKKRMMTWKSWKLGQEPCNHSSPWLEKRLWLPILGANVFCWGERIKQNVFYL